MSARPKTYQDAIEISATLTDEAVRNGVFGKVKPNDKRKWNNKNNDVGSSRNSNSFKKPANAIRSYITTQPPSPANQTGRTGYAGSHPKCNQCNYHHSGQFQSFKKCNCQGHSEKNYKMGQQGCFECVGLDHIKSACPRLARGPANNPARRRAFMLNANEARVDTNVVTGTFPLNNHYAFVLFDSGDDRSFISVEFASFIGLVPSSMPESFVVKLANGGVIKANTVVPGCSLNVYDHMFPVDLMPLELGSFDVVIGMDWLPANKAEIIYGFKIIRIPLSDNQVLEIQGERPGKELRIISCMKARKYLLRKHHTFRSWRRS
jgi:hypothetical protein